MGICFIITGCPGSGKSFLAEKLAEKYNAVICSTDSYFIDKESGEYKFDFNLLGANHNKNYRRACAMMDNNVSVIIDNTNIKTRDIRPYLEHADECDFDIVFVTPKNDWSENAEECFKRNKHGVPLEKIKEMLKNKKSPEYLVDFFKKEKHERLYTLEDFEALRQ